MFGEPEVRVPADAADQAERDRRREVGREELGVAHDQRPVAGLERAAVAQLGERELLARLLREELDQGDVAGLVAADGDGVVQLAVRQAAGEGRA